MTQVAVALRRVAARDALLEGLESRERVLLPARATSKRRAEYAAGRKAAHAALVRLLGPAAEGSAVVPVRGAGGGRPVAQDPRGRQLPVHLSITHASGLAAAAAAPCPLGLDLVVLEPLGGSFLEEAFVPGELERWARWSGAARDEAACAAFAAKEAALKWLGTGLELPLHALRVEPAAAGRPARLGGTIAALSLPVRIEVDGRGRILDGWIAGSRRRVLVAVCGA